MNKHFFWLPLLFLFSLSSIWAEARETWNINPVWRFCVQTTEEDAISPNFVDDDWDLISLPHTMKYFPANLNGFEEEGRILGWYRKHLEIKPEWESKEIILVFQGAMQATRLFVNGQFVGQYRVSGYDSFHFDITDFVKVGDNLISVEVDNRPTTELPPDGVKHDFILFGGLYRDVELVVTDPSHISFNWDSSNSGITVTYPALSQKSATVAVQVEVLNNHNFTDNLVVENRLYNPEGKLVSKDSSSLSVKSQKRALANQKLPAFKNPDLWSPNSPSLYKLETRLLRNGSLIDSKETQLGLRTIEWNKKKGFILNEQPIELIGTNRHQTWPFVGGAITNALHRRDAEQIKEMGMNFIRLSHYPHDPDFLDALDELGICALEEGPTWMDRIEGTWMRNLETSFRRMIRRDKNHPSIITWNACINHGGYEQFLVNAGRQEDKTRALATYDIIADMDFNHGRISTGGAITLEHTGHMYPTSRGQRNFFPLIRGGINREVNQAKRHMEMTELSFKEKSNYAMASWCGYDYNTFHNSDEAIARHGIFDLFRLPKYSYYWHKSELNPEPMAYIVREAKYKAIVYSNADSIILYGIFAGQEEKIGEQTANKSSALNHPPYYFKLKKDYSKLIAKAKFTNETLTSTWEEPGWPEQIKLIADRDEIVADGADISRIIVQVLDKEGNIVEKDDTEIEIQLEGEGALIGANPLKTICGQHIILVQAGYEPGDLKISATSRGLESDEIEIEVKEAPKNMLFPTNFEESRPTTPNLYWFYAKEKLKLSTIEKVEPFSFAPIVDAPADEWVESKPMMVGGISGKTSIKVEGGEYRIYSEAWTDESDKVRGGDAVTVRVKSSEKSGETVSVTLTIGDQKADFSVTTK